MRVEIGMKQNRTIVIGVTGNSGSGKSVVSGILAEVGAKIIDADKIGHEILMPGGSAFNEVIALFGVNVLTSDGFIDRKKIASIVFSDKEILKKHTEITHKYIINETFDKLREYKAEGIETVVLDAPLLIEANLHSECDYVWLVLADYDKKVSRIAVRDAMSLEQAEKRIMAQSDQEKLKDYADFVFYNNGRVDELKDNVITELKKITREEMI